MKGLQILLIASILSLTFFVSDAVAFSCTIRSNSCSGVEVCLFSLLRQTNSHVADCSAYQYKVCCDFESSELKAGSCNLYQTGIISLYKVSNSHLEIYGYFNYGNHVCTNESLTCTLQNSCDDDQVCVASFYRDLNSHAARCNYYNNSLCCRSSKPYTLKGIALNYETGLPIHSGVVTGIIKETGETAYSSISEDGFFLLKFNSTVNATKNKFTLSLVINSSDNKMGYVKLIAGSGEFVSGVQTCSVKIWHFSGQAIDTATGKSISSGTIAVSVLGTTYTNSTSFANGAWDIYLSPCLVSGELYTFQFTVSGEDKISSTFINQIAK